MHAFIFCAYLVTQRQRGVLKVTAPFVLTNFVDSLEQDDANDCVGELKHFVTGIFSSLLAPFLQAGLGIHSVWQNFIQFWAIQQSASNHYASSSCFCIRNEASVRSERVRFLTCVSTFRSIFP